MEVSATRDVDDDGVAIEERRGNRAELEERLREAFERAHGLVGREHADAQVAAFGLRARDRRARKNAERARVVRYFIDARTARDRVLRTIGADDDGERIARRDFR